MNPRDALKILEGVGAVITDSHIVYTSGKHGPAYINKDALYPHTRETSMLCRAIAERFAANGVQVVIAPAVGGVILSTWTADFLTKMTLTEVLAVYADKAMIDGEDNFVIKRGYEKIIPKKRVLVVEDLLTTGGSVLKVVKAVRAIGGHVVGVGVLCNRGGVTVSDLGGVPKLEALTDIKMDAWDANDCPLCAKNIPINTSVGHGREFLTKKKLP